MDDIEGIAKQWGSSLAVVIPKEIAKKERIKRGDKIHIRVEKHSDLSDVFGTLKTHVSGQKFKDMCREGWE
ncbi:MAG TPA: AbrB/MazE/SpoVT family DNA-binding domain-containing protein [Candidatus Bilamarchaeaceae archaeon]|nr:AbrB/MazE/SpoVT family DNA-binding domain-containing protein [Candidatus Bilamarchaeaceae archaeon]